MTGDVNRALVIAPTHDALALIIETGNRPRLAAVDGIYVARRLRIGRDERLAIRREQVADDAFGCERARTAAVNVVHVHAPVVARLFAIKEDALAIGKPAQ